MTTISTPNSSIADIEQVQTSFNEELLEDAVIERHLTPLFEKLVQDKISQLLTESIEVPFETLVSQLSLKRDQSKNLIDRMIRQGKIKYYDGKIYESSSFDGL